MNLLKDKVALVTGGSRGIGSAIVRAFAAEGAHVAFTYLSSEKPALEIQEELTAMGVKAKAYKSDASSFTQSEELVKNVLADFEKIDVLVSPVTPSSAPKIGEVKDPLEMYLSDAYTVGFSLGQLPVITCPQGTATGVQITGAKFKEAQVLQFANFIKSLK